MRRCWLSLHLDLRDPCGYRADGQPDAAHIGFTKSWLLHSPTGPHLDADEASDPSLLRPVCRKHHSALDYGRLSLTREQLPASVERFAREHHMPHGGDLTWKLDGDYGPR